MNDDYCNLISKELSYKVSNTYSLKNIINDLKESIKNNDKIRIWTTHNQSVSFDYYNNIILDKLKELSEVKVVRLVDKLMNNIHLYDTIFTYLISRLIIEKKYWLYTIKSNK